MIRYHGIFAANASRRSELQHLMPHQSGAFAPSIAKGKKHASPCYRHRWLDLLERVFGHSPCCPRCQGPMQIIQFVEDPEVIERILNHLDLPTDLPPLTPARAPPEDELDLCFAQTVPDTEPDWLD